MLARSIDRRAAQDFQAMLGEALADCDHLAPFCLGLDPSRELQRDWGLSDDTDGLRRFCGVVMEAAADRVAVVKPQSAFFERLGPLGLSRKC